jgi:hypothetical protein
LITCCAPADWVEQVSYKVRLVADVYKCILKPRTLQNIRLLNLSFLLLSKRLSDCAELSLDGGFLVLPERIRHLFALAVIRLPGR